MGNVTGPVHQGPDLQPILCEAVFGRYWFRALGSRRCQFLPCSNPLVQPSHPALNQTLKTMRCSWSHTSQCLAFANTLSAHLESSYEIPPILQVPSQSLHFREERGIFFWNTDARSCLCFNTHSDLCYSSNVFDKRLVLAHCLSLEVLRLKG